MDVTFLNVEVDLLAVVLASLAAMIVGFIFYAPPVLGNYWMKVNNLDPKNMGSPGLPLTMMFLTSFVTAFLMAWFMPYIGLAIETESEVTAGIVSALMLWLLVGVAGNANVFFEKRNFVMPYVLSIGSHLASMLAMGLVLGLMA